MVKNMTASEFRAEYAQDITRAMNNVAEDNWHNAPPSALVKLDGLSVKAYLVTRELSELCASLGVVCDIAELVALLKHEARLIPTSYAPHPSTNSFGAPVYQCEWYSGVTRTYVLAHNGEGLYGLAEAKTYQLGYGVVWSAYPGLDAAWWSLRYAVEKGTGWVSEKAARAALAEALKL